MPKNIFVCILTLFFGTTCLLFGQETIEKENQHIYIRTNDGNHYEGKVILDQGEIIEIETQNLGKIRIQKEDIRKVKVYDFNQKRIKSYAVKRHLQSSRYFLLANGYGLRKNEGFYQNASLLINRASYGITNNIAVGAGVIPLVFFAKTPTPVYLSAKGSFPIIRNKINLGIGAVGAKILGSEIPTVGFLYGVSTFGNSNRNASIGIAYSIINTEDSETSPTPITVGDKPILTISGTFRYSEHNYILTENYIPSSSFSADEEFTGFFSLGGRTVWPQASFNYGLFVPIPVETSLGISLILPWIGITIPF